MKFFKILSQVHIVILKILDRVNNVIDYERLKKYTNPIETYSFKMVPPKTSNGLIKKSMILYKRVVDDIKIYYHFTNVPTECGKFVLKSGIFSDSLVYIDIKTKDDSHDTKYILKKYTGEVKITSKIIDLKKNLLVKKAKIENSLYSGGLRRTRPSKRILTTNDKSENSQITKKSNLGNSSIQINRINSKLTPNTNQMIKKTNLNQVMGSEINPNESVVIVPVSEDTSIQTDQLPVPKDSSFQTDLITESFNSNVRAQQTPVASNSTDRTEQSPVDGDSPNQHDLIPVAIHSTEIQANTDSLEQESNSQIQLDLNREIELPKYCKQTHRPCEQRINYINIFDDNYAKAMRQNQINDELGLHGHPKSRKVNKGKNQRFRLTHEGLKELQDHYNFGHGFFG